MTGQPFKGWALLELMGHRRLAGWVEEVELAGHGMLRLDVPASVQPVERGELTPEDTAATQFYSPAALYCLTPTTEDIARRFAVTTQPRPVKSWELPPGPGIVLDEQIDDDPELDVELPDEGPHVPPGVDLYEMCKCGHQRRDHENHAGDIPGICLTHMSGGVPCPCQAFDFDPSYIPF